MSTLLNRLFPPRSADEAAGATWPATPTATPAP